jgi:hypothetical protein
MTTPTNTPDFNDQAVNFNDFALPTAGETAGIVGEQIAQKTGQAARMVALATALTATAAANVACGGGDDPTPTKPEEPKLTDTPENKAAFMADVKPAVLGGGMATLDFEAVWNGYGYNLLPRPHVNFDEVNTHLANMSEGARDKMTAFGLYYSAGDDIRVSWRIPKEDLETFNGNISLNDSKFTKYLQVIPNSNNNPNTAVAKWKTGFLRICILNGVEALTDIQVIDPYAFGKL